MGTHPIFESDFDCLTEVSLASLRNYFWFWRGALIAGHYTLAHLSHD